MSENQFTLTRHPDGPVAIFTITRPDRANALSHTVVDGLIAALETLPEDCEALLIAGNATVFSAGADLGCVRGRCADPRPIQPLLDALTTAIQAAPFPVAALIDGPCVGAAVELVLTCDARFATTGASLRIPATEIGTVYRSTGVENLRRRLPFVALQSLLLFGNTIPAAHAQAWGLVESVANRDAAVAEFLVKLTRISTRPGVFAAQKASLNVAAGAVSLSAESHKAITDIRNENAGSQAPQVEMQSR